MSNYVLPLTTLDDIFLQTRLVDATAVNSTPTATASITSANAFTRDYLKQLLYDISDEMQQHFNRKLTPYYEAKEFYSDYIYQHCWYNEERRLRQLDLDMADGDDSLSISAFDWNGTAFTASNYRYTHPNSTPNSAVVFDRSTTLSTLDNFTDRVTVTGIWGYHDNASLMWKDSGDTVQNASQIDATGTSLTVTDADNFETYQLIRIEDEYCFITDLNSDTNVLTIERARNGTTGVVHATDTQIDVFVPMPTVAKECRRMVLRSWFLKDDPKGNIYLTEQAIKEVGEGSLKPIIPVKWAMGAV